MFKLKTIGILAALLLPILLFSQSTIYVAPNGSSGNSGANSSSPTTLENALDNINAGGTIFVRGGTYNYSSTIVISSNNNGSSGNRKKVFAYSGTPVLRFAALAESPSNRGIVLDGNYWHFKGITIEEAGDNGMLLSGDDNIIEDCVFRKNHDTGLQLSRFNTSNNSINQWPSDNLILDCESYDNRDSDNEDADGFAAKLTCGRGNIFRGCVAHHNIDDGWDLYTKSSTGPIGVVVFEDCIAHSNGTLTSGGTSGGGDKNGYKLGSSAHEINHIVRRCIAYNNGKHGFTDNGNTGRIEFTNTTSFGNDGYNYHTRDGGSHVFKNNVSFDNSTNDRLRGNFSAPNSFVGNEGGFNVNSSDFVTLSPASNANPTSNGFLKPRSGSDLIDAGVTTSGISYSGSRPDLGAIEAGGSSSGDDPPADDPPADDPPADDPPADDPPSDDPPPAGGQVHNFTVSGKSSNFYNISGNLSSSKGTVSYNGLTLTQCLKIESSTSITFNASSTGTLTLVFNSNFSREIKIDGTRRSVNNGILSISLSSGSHSITKDDSCNLYYMSFSGSGSGGGGGGEDPPADDPPADDPPADDPPADDPPADDPPPAGGQVHNFTVSGKSSNFYNISGNLSSSKGTVSYNGLTLTQCLKIESSTSITFNASSTGTLTLVFNSNFSGDIKIDGTSRSVNNGILSISLSSGSHSITKDNTCNLYYMSFGQTSNLTSGGSESASISSLSSHDESLIRDKSFSVGKANDLEVVVYPNPSADFITVKLASNRMGNVHILNAAGRLVYSSPAFEGVHRVDLTTLERGIYLVKVSDGARESVRKIIKQ